MKWKVITSLYFLKRVTHCGRQNTIDNTKVSLFPWNLKWQCKNLAINPFRELWGKMQAASWGNLYGNFLVLVNFYSLYIVVSHLFSFSFLINSFKPCTFYVYNSVTRASRLFKFFWFTVLLFVSIVNTKLRVQWFVWSQAIKECHKYTLLSSCCTVALTGWTIREHN